MFNSMGSEKCNRLFKYIITKYLDECQRTITINLQDMVDNKMYKTQETAYREMKEFIESLSNSELYYRLKGFTSATRIFEDFTFSYSDLNYTVTLLLTPEFQEHTKIFISCIADKLIERDFSESKLYKIKRKQSHTFSFWKKELKKKGGYIYAK